MLSLAGYLVAMAALFLLLVRWLAPQRRCPSFPRPKPQAPVDRVRVVTQQRADTLVTRTVEPTRYLSPRVNFLKQTILQRVVWLQNISSPELAMTLDAVLTRHLFELSFSVNEPTLLERYALDQHHLTSNRSHDLVIVCYEHLLTLPDPLVSGSQKISMCQYMIKYGRDHAVIHRCYQYLIRLARTPSNPVLCQNAVDILMMSNHSELLEIGEECLERLRRQSGAPTEVRSNRLVKPNAIGAKHPPSPRTGVLSPSSPSVSPAPSVSPMSRKVAAAPRTLYQDGQNVHNRHLNQYTKAKAKALAAKFPPTGCFDYEVLERMQINAGDREKVYQALFRIMTDEATFNMDLNLATVFGSLTAMIQAQPDENVREQLNRRLVEELIEMSDQCATGHLSRLINVCSGFESPEDTHASVAVADEIYATLSHHIQQQISTAPNSEELLVALTESPLPPFALDFFNQQRNVLSEQLRREYNGVANAESIEQHLSAALTKFMAGPDLS